MQIRRSRPSSCLHHRRRPVGNAPPLPPKPRIVLERRMHRRKQRIRTGMLPGWPQIDQVERIRPQPMAKNHQLLGRRLGGRSPVNRVEAWHAVVSPVPALTYQSMIVTRFAPSPTGYLHLGHAFSAFNAWKRARDAGGQFLLRLEDIDPTRCRPEYAEAILEDLTWLGLDGDGPVRVQSQHLPDYRAVLDQLADRNLVYPCFCTRAD